MSQAHRRHPGLDPESRFSGPRTPMKKAAGSRIESGMTREGQGCPTYGCPDPPAAPYTCPVAKLPSFSASRT